MAFARLTEKLGFSWPHVAVSLRKYQTCSTLLSFAFSNVMEVCRGISASKAEDAKSPISTASVV